MKQAKHLAFAITLTFLAGMFWSAQAQVVTKATKLQGIEVAAGTEDAEKGVVYGASFLGKTTGVYPGSFFLSMTYATQPVGVLPTRSIQNIITIGTWSLPVYRSNQYLGAIYGQVIDGTLEWNADRTIARVNMVLSVDGGTQTYVKAAGKANFVGTLNRTTRGKPTLNGALTFEF